MAEFQYEAVDASGKRRKGGISADSEKEARRKLFDQGMVVTKLVAVGGAKAAGFEWKTLVERRLGTTDLILFTQQFRTLYTAGIPLPETFRILCEQVDNKHFKKVVEDMQRRIIEGESLYQAFSSHRGVFSSLYCSMIAAGESSGSIPDVLERLIYLLDHDEKTRQKIESALRYPKMVILAMVLAFLVLLNFVIPQFSSLYAGAGIELPVPTQIAVALYNWCQDYWLINVAAVIAAVYSWKAFIRTEKGVLWRDTMALRIPVIGTVVQKAAIARFASIFAILQRSGISILSSMDIIRDTVDNAFFQSQFASIISQIQAGGGIGSAVASVKGFTPLAVSLISVGERAGKLEEMLNNLAKHYDNEVEIAVEELTEWVGPMLIVCLGVVVLFFALAIFLPMWDLVKFV